MIPTGDQTFAEIQVEKKQEQGFNIELETWLINSIKRLQKCLVGVATDFVIY